MLLQVPLLTMLPLTGHQREPRPISWAEQRKPFELLPPHLKQMCLFTLNTGVRDNVVGNLRWDREIQIELAAGLICSVFEVPTAHYSQAQLREVRAALELIKNEAGIQNRSLRSLAREARQQRAVPPVPSGSLQQRKTG